MMISFAPRRDSALKKKKKKKNFRNTALELSKLLAALAMLDQMYINNLKFFVFFNLFMNC